MLRSPQHLIHSESENIVWKIQIGSNTVEVAVNPKDHQTLINTDAATQQMILERLHNNRQQTATTTETPQRNSVKSPLPTHSTPNQGEEEEAIGGAFGGLFGEVQDRTHQPLSSRGAIGGARSPTSQLLSPGGQTGGEIGGTPSHHTHHQLPPKRLDFSTNLDQPKEDDKASEFSAMFDRASKGQAQAEETLKKYRQPPVGSQRHDPNNWTYTATEQQHEEEHRACNDRQHEFEKRAKQHLAVPAKRFMAAYNSCIFHFKRNVDQLISNEFIMEIMDELLRCYKEMEQTRDYCMEVLSREDKLKNPRYEEYMALKLDLLNECKQLEDQYVTYQNEKEQNPQQSLRSEEAYSAIKHGPTTTGTTPRVPQPNAKLPSRVQERKERLQNVTSIITRNTRPEIHFQPQGKQGQGKENPQDPNWHFYQGKHGQGTEKPQQQNWRFYQGGQGQGTEEAQQPNSSSYQGPQGQETGESQRKRVLSEENSNNSSANMLTPESSGRKGPEPQFRFKLAEELQLVSFFDARNPRDYMAFRAQWMNFENKMIKSGRPQEDLYDALLKVLRGSAKDLCKNKYHDPGAYQWSIQQLDRLYNKPENLLRQMITNLLKTNKMVDTYESLLGGVTQLQEAWHDLNQANLSKEELKGLLFIAASEKNLSEGSWKCWLDAQNNHTGDALSIFKASNYLGAIETALSNAQKRREAGRSSTVIDHKNKPKPQTRSTVFGSYSAMTQNAPRQNAPRQNTSKFAPQKQAKTKDGKCVFCQGTPHNFQLYCPKLKTMTPGQVWNIVREHNINCRMCLSLGHNQNQCDALKGGRLKKCNIKDANGEMCSRLHCRYLHRNLNEQTEQ